MSKSELITKYLSMCGKSSIKELSDEQVVFLYPLLNDEPSQYSVIAAFEERIGNDAHRFAEVVRDCIDSGFKIRVYAVLLECVADKPINGYQLRYDVIKD